MATSGLKGLKRSWSGNSSDINGLIGVPSQSAASNGAAAATTSMTATTTTMPTSNKGNINISSPPKNAINKSLLPSSSPVEVPFSWSPSPSPSRRDPLSDKSNNGARGGNRADSAKQRHSPQIAIPVDDEEEDLDDVETERRAEPPLKKRQLPQSWKRSGTGGSNSSSASFQSASNASTTRSASTSSMFKPSVLDKTASDLRREGKSSTNFLVKGHGTAAETKEHPFGGASRKLGGVFLSREQAKVRDMVVNGGKNVFFTGSAGTGKSVLLREIISQLRLKYNSKPDAVAITASTGIAACNIGGVTIHSYAGAGLADGTVDQICSKIRRNRKSNSRWLRTQTLIVDEVSMVDPGFLDKIEETARKLRKSSKPFGGIQLVLTGDFFQLPPVTKNNAPTRFAFDAKCWSQVIHEMVNLTQVFRQKDENFVQMLNEMRIGKLSEDSVQRFKALSRTPEIADGLVPTQLFALRQEVDRANVQRLNGIKAPLKMFDAHDGGTLPEEQRQRMLEKFMPPPKLMLKAGAQVMLIKNIDETLVNGSVGTILTFLDTKDHKMALHHGIDWDRIRPGMTVEQVDEIITEYLLSKPVPAAERSAKAFRADAIANEYMYSAAAASKKLKAGKVDEEDCDENDFESNGDKDRKATASSAAPSGGSNATMKVQIPRNASSRSASPEKGAGGPLGANLPKYPVVRFILPNGGYRTEHMTPEVWKNELPNGEILASRTQIPLMLAWAMSIHKSQGQTLPYCRVDLGKVFEKGQAYVALSRATSLEGLQVLNFNQAKVMTDPRVITWTRQLKDHSETSS